MNRIVCACLLALVFIVPARADYTFSRTTINYGSLAVGLTVRQGCAITNTGSTPITIQSVSLSGTGFQFAAGIFPVVLSENGASYSYGFNFVPTAAQSYTATATFMIDGAPVSITLNGTGVTTTAVTTPSVRGLTFTAPQGQQSRQLSVKITNTGTGTVSVLSVATQPPFSTPPVGTTVLAPGVSASFLASYFGDNPGSTTGDLLISYDLLPPTGIALIGTTTAPTKFGITTFSSLPLGTAGFPYLAQLTAVAGMGNVSWRVASGSLPLGLTLSSSGAISGTIDSAATLSTYTFTVSAADAQSDTASAALSLQVLPPTGSACDYISWDIGGTTNPIVPISDLGTGTYFGTEGGLYGNGRNTPPPQHDSDGVAYAQAIQPLDSNGNPSQGGKYALVGIGISSILDEMKAFVPLARADGAVSPNLVVVNGGQAKANAGDFTNLYSPFWTTLLNNIVPNAGVTPKQVVAVMFEDLDVAPSGTYPGDMVKLQNEFETVAQNMLTQFPNLKLMYYVSRVYSGYSGTFDLQSPEPYAYEQGLAIQGAILAQINGAAKLNYNPANGPVMAPWLGYGPYTWANGMIARSDGLTYNCQDFLSDGRHPSLTYGAPKVAAQFLNFFKTTDTTAPWFLAR